MTVIAPSGERWSFGGVDLNTHAINVRSVAGADDSPELRGENPAFGGLPGRLSVPKLEDERRIALGLWVTSLDPDGVAPANEREAARARLDDLKAVLLVRDILQPLVRTMPDGSTRTAQAEVIKVDGVEDPASGEIYALVADFLLADPYFFGPEVVVTQAIAASPTDFILTSPGNRRGHRLMVDFTGPIEMPRLTNLTIDPDGEHYVEFLGTVDAGLHAIIDVQWFLATNDGANAIGSVAHSGALAFLEIDPGANNLRVTSTAPGGSLTLTFQPPYI